MNQPSDSELVRQLHTRIFGVFGWLLLLGWLGLGVCEAVSAGWSARLDGKVLFYQSTELGALVVGTEKSLYALDGESGEVLWRRKNLRLEATDVAPVVGTDLLLLNLEKDKRARLEAVDLLTGKPVWQSDKLKGSVMHLAVDLPTERVAVVLARDASSNPRAGFKRRPTVYLLSLASGEMLWRHELDSEVEMMPARWVGDEDELRETVYTLDNYRAPLFLDGRLYLFYEGVTALDARSGKEQMREKFRVNEEGLALTEAEALADEEYLYVSGRGRVRAIARASGKIVWEANDVGFTPELMRVGELLFVRTGGRFTRLKDGAVVERGPYGISAIDVATGKIRWRYKGADKGITNLALANDALVLCADRDELLVIDAATGKVRSRVKHRLEGAAFVLINEYGDAVVGGRDEIAAFSPALGNLAGGEQAVWRTRHEAPGRGVLRTMAAIAARSASLYFRYGGVATTAFRGAQLASSLGSLRVGNLVSRIVLPNLTDYAAGAAREYVTNNLKPYGILTRAQRRRSAIAAMRAPQVTVDVDVTERLLDRLDPAHQLDKLARFLWRRQRLAVLSGEQMYFYTELEAGGHGLAGVNLNTGATQRQIKLNEPDPRLTTDEILGLLYAAQGDHLSAYGFDR